MAGTRSTPCPDHDGVAAIEARRQRFRLTAASEAVSLISRAPREHRHRQRAEDQATPVPPLLEYWLAPDHEVSPSMATESPNCAPARATSAAVNLATEIVCGAAVARAEDVPPRQSRAGGKHGKHRRNHHGVAVDGHGAAEGVVRRGIGGRQLGHLIVRGATIGRTEDATARKPENAPAAPIAKRCHRRSPRRRRSRRRGAVRDRRVWRPRRRWRGTSGGSDARARFSTPKVPSTPPPPAHIATVLPSIATELPKDPYASASLAVILSCAKLAVLRRRLLRLSTARASSSAHASSAPTAKKMKANARIVGCPGFAPAS